MCNIPKSILKKLINKYLVALSSTGTSKESDETFKGLIEIPNLSEENEPHEIDVSVLNPYVMKCCHTTLKSDRFLAIFMEHRLNTQHSQLHSLL